jgi:hypothetical protein
LGCFKPLLIAHGSKLLLKAALHPFHRSFICCILLFLF